MGKLIAGDGDHRIQEGRSSEARALARAVRVGSVMGERFRQVTGRWEWGRTGDMFRVSTSPLGGTF